MRSTTDVPANRAVHGSGLTLESALVTGATGHIGSALVRRLSSNGVRTAALVRQNSPTRSNLPSGPQVSAIEIDASDPRTLRESLAAANEAANPDVVFNLASSGVNPADRQPLAMFDGNARFLATILDALQNKKPRLFIHVGSCSEYAATETGHPMSEEDPLGPASLYGAAKLCASIYGAASAAEHGIHFVNLRLFGVYGVGESPHRVVPYLIAKLRENQPVDLTPGEQFRDWLYIDDVVNALLAAATCPRLPPVGVFNVCSGRGTRVREIAELVADTMQKPRDLLRFGARPYRPDEAMWIVGDNHRFVEATSWTPRVPLAEGIRRMVEHSA